MGIVTGHKLSSYSLLHTVFCVLCAVCNMLSKQPVQEGAGLTALQLNRKCAVVIYE